MEKLGRISFVALLGDAPLGQELDALPDAASVAGIVQSAFTPFLHDSDAFTIVEPVQPVEAPLSGLHLVYVYGHAWLTPAGPQVSTRAGATSVFEDAHDLFARLVPADAADRTLLILDCCHAGAFDPFLTTDRLPRLVVYGSGGEEKAIALPRERASRLSLVIADKLSGRNRAVDLIQMIAAVAEQLDGDGVLRGQSVTYRVNGLGIRLGRKRTIRERRRERTVAIVRNILLGVGAAMAVAVIMVGWFYWSHTLVQLDVADLNTIADDLRLVASEEDPNRNVSRTIESRSISGGYTRLWIRASNVLLRVEGKYHDGADRALGFHLNLEPGFNLAAKSVLLKVPPTKAVEAHPRMAYVPNTPWFHGRELERRTNETPYWIDLRPPTVAEYLVLARELLAAGELDQDNSFVLSARQRSAAVDSLGLGQLRKLNRDLGDIFGIIEKSTSPGVGAASDIVVGLGDLPCDSCPAPMTLLEARLFCRQRNLRLPTDVEWELAARGIDGRVFPWGNQFDATRANVPGLPQKGDPPTTLKPVDAYAGERSPFGLIDTIGNAGDWVINTLGSYERIFIGATHRHNQEDATTFRVIPVTDSDYLVREITARCVSGSPVVE